MFTKSGGVIMWIISISQPVQPVVSFIIYGERPFDFQFHTFSEGIKASGRGTKAHRYIDMLYVLSV